MLSFILVQTQHLASLLGFRRYGPNQCRVCGAPALIIDDERPWRRYCGPCYLPIAEKHLKTRNS